MTYTEIYLVRHAITDHNQNAYFQGVSDIPLNEDGHEQAQYLKERFLKEGIVLDKIITSNLVRTQETAAPLAEALQIKMEVVADFREVNGGKFEGQAHVTNSLNYPQVMDCIMTKPYYTAFPEGESGEEVYRRAVAAIEKVAKDNLGKKVMIVAHGFVLQMLRPYLFGENPEETGRLICANTAVTKLRFAEDGSITVEYLFDASHLPDKWQASNESKATSQYFKYREQLLSGELQKEIAENPIADADINGNN